MARRNGGFIGTDGLDAPDPPTGVTPTVGNQSLSIAFTAPTDTGTSAITGFVAQVSTDGTAYSAGSNTGTSSPIVVSSLSNGTSYTAKVWAINAYGTSAPSDASASFTPAAPIGIFHAGYASATNTLDQLTISTTGNTTDWGDLTLSRYEDAGASNSIRGLFAGGENAGGAKLNTVDFIVFATVANATDFGDLGNTSFASAGVSNSTRAVFTGNIGGTSDNRMEYFTIASAGNATDFGDQSVTRYQLGGCQSTTRGVFGGGNSTSNVIDYITTASTGNATDFGNLTVGRPSQGGASNTTRGMFFGGESAGDNNIVDYITIASTGNATDFGNLSNSNSLHCMSVASSTRAVSSVGNNNNTLDFFTIASTGDATDFGDLSSGSGANGAVSNVHGGT